jgi:hypothetical protein
LQNCIYISNKPRLGFEILDISKIKHFSFDHVILIAVTKRRETIKKSKNVLFFFTSRVPFFFLISYKIYTIRNKIKFSTIFINQAKRRFAFIVWVRDDYYFSTYNSISELESFLINYSLENWHGAQ